MIIPKKCTNVDCNLFHTHELKSFKKRQLRANKALADHLDTQSRIIANLTEQIRITTEQVFKLTQHINEGLQSFADTD